MSNSTEAIEHWVERIVVGLGLCPFAAEPVRKGRVHYVDVTARTFDDAVGAVLAQVGELLETGDVSTTLCCFSAALADFDDFLDACAAVEALLEEAGADSFVQIAHFHPDYQFADVETDDPANMTNRAPAPVIQLLRVEEMSALLADFPDPDAIPERNIALMRELGAEGVAEQLDG